jgi:uncharacterized protein YoaH (UPF0181 family)
MLDFLKKYSPIGIEIQASMSSSSSIDKAIAIAVAMSLRNSMKNANATVSFKYEDVRVCVNYDSDVESIKRDFYLVKTGCIEERPVGPYSKILAFL